MFSTTNNALLHVVQFVILINLISEFYLCYMGFLPIKAVNNTDMRTKIRVMPWLPNMQDLKLFTPRWCLFSGFRREHVAVVFGSTGSQYLINGCLQPIGTKITQDWKPKIVDTHSKNGAVTVFLSLSPIIAANTSSMNNNDQGTGELLYFQN